MSHLALAPPTPQALLALLEQVEEKEKSAAPGSEREAKVLPTATAHLLNALN